MKKILLMLCVAAAAVSCSREDSPAPVTPDEATPVYLTVGLKDLGFENETGYEPMSRAESYATYINPFGYDCLILKQEGDDWYVERKLTPRITGLPTGNIISGSGPVVSDYRIELTPGHYHMLIVLNNSAQFNPILKPGYKIPETPPYAVGYGIVTAAYGREGALNLPHEVFAGTQEFDVVKTTGLEPSSAVQSVDVEVTRRVGTIGIYFKENERKTGARLAASVALHLKAKEGAKFCEGIDVFGNPYYSSEGLTDFFGNYYISQGAAPSAKGDYYFPKKNGRVSGHFYFTEAGKEVPYSIDYIDIAVRSNEINYIYSDPVGVSGILRHNRTGHLTFSTTDSPLSPGNFDLNPEYSQEEVEGLFPPDYMWTTNID